MSTNSSLIVGACLIVGCLILGLLFGHPAAGQPAVAPPPAAGPYQIVVKPGPQNTAVFVFDARTGQVWFRDTNPQVKGWTNMGSPTIQVKE